MRRRNRQLSFILAIALIFSSFQLPFLGSGNVYAAGAPEITDISLIATTTVEGTQSLKYQIYGMNFDNPTFWIDGRSVTSSGYEVVDGAYLIIRTSENNDFFESGLHKFKVQNVDGTESASDLDFTVKIAAWVTSISKSKVYIGESLTIYGTGIYDDGNIKEVIIGGNPYALGEYVIDETEQKITIANVKSAMFPRNGDVKIVKNTSDATSREIVGVYKSAISVVGKITGVEVDKVVPNTGPVDGGSTIRIIGKDGASDFRSDMKIYVDTVDGGNALSDIELLYDEGDSSVIGISGTMPKSPTNSQGVFPIIITDNTGSNELEIENAFTYEDKDNLLRLLTVTPPYGKGVSDEDADITGRNIITLNIPNLSEWTVNTAVYSEGSYYDHDKNAFIIEYEGIYGEGSGGSYNVDITREIKLILGKTTEITEYKYDTAQDKVVAKIPSVTEPGPVSVTMQTSTEVRDKVTEEYVFSREEEDTLTNGFTFLPATTIPVIDSVEPSMGPLDELIYLTIRGSDFQVLTKDAITEYPIIDIGDRMKIIDPNSVDADDITVNSDWIKIYDDEGNEVNGVGRITGTIIKTAIPAHGISLAEGEHLIKITNPDLGTSVYSDDASKKIKLLKHSRASEDLPIVTNISPHIGPIEGGAEIVIEGDNFDYKEITPDVVVTIDGLAAQITKATKTKIEAIVPPGITIGDKIVQIITEDGAIVTADDRYTYIRQVSNPEIEEIAPAFGGKGTVVYIFGRDKGEDQPNFYAPDPLGARIEDKIGTRVFLNDIDVNDKEESSVEIIDRNTIRVTIPGGYSPGLKRLTVINPDTSTANVEGAFNYKIPPEGQEVKITNIDPDYGSYTGGMFITIEGENFKDGAKVYFGGKEASNVTVSGNRDKISLRTPPYELPNPDIEPSKIVDVTVVNYDGSTATSEPQYDVDEKYIGGGYTYMVPESEPIINDVTPSEGTTIGNEYISLTGVDFRKYYDTEKEIYIYPKVYFGGEEAKEVIYIDDTELYVKTPFHSDEGGVDITVINPDAGTYVKLNGFTYRMTKPIIDEVIPDRGHKDGGQEIIIKGKDILAGDFSDEIKLELLDGDTPKINVLAIFGEEKDDDKVILNQAENELGDIRIDYHEDRGEVDLNDGGKTTDNVLIYHKDITKPIAHYDLNPDERHLFILEWEKILGEAIGAEGVLVELRDEELKTTRRIAPKAEVMDATGEDKTKTLIVQTPPVAYIGERNLYIENKDRGWSSTTFEYLSPSSDPIIKSITPSSEVKNSEEEVIKYHVESTIEGGLYITIDGYDLRKDVEVFIDGTPAPLVSRVVLNEEDSEGRLRTRLVVKSPKGDTDDLNKELRIMIVNADGGFLDASDISKIIPQIGGQDAKPYFFVYRIPESKPYLDSILPAETSQAGNNKVRIVGYDFRTGASVLIGGRKASIDFIDSDEIVILTPTDLTPGLKDVQIINTDHGAVTKTAAIKIVSYPEITKVTTEGGQSIQRVSIEGGFKIVLLGKNFQNGSKVYFGGSRKKIGVSDNAEAKGLFKDDNYYEIDNAYQAKEVVFVNENQLLVTVPEVFKEGDYSITILNADRGLSDDGKTIDYKVPIPSDPVNLKAEIVNDKYIRIYGYSSKDVSYYEVYTYLGDDSPDDEDFEYLNTTNRTSYRITKFKDIDDDEDIYLKIRAVNKYGPSEWSNEVKISYNILEDIDGIGEEDEDGDLVSNYQEDVSRDGVNVVLGDKGFRGSEYDLYEIDLKDKKYQNIDTRTINIPGKIIKESSRIILVDNGETRIQFTPRNFNVYSFYNMSSSEQDRVYGRLTFKKIKGSEADPLEKKIPRKYKLKSKIYEVKTEFQSGRNLISVESTSGAMDLEISYDENLLMGMDESKLQLHKFDPDEGKWLPLAGGIDKENNRVYARIYGQGRYAILGEK